MTRATASRVFPFAIAVLSMACPTKPTPDGGPAAEDAGSAQLLHAHTGEGKVLHAYFSEAVAPANGDVELYGADAGAKQEVTVESIAADPTDPKHLLVTLATGLPRDRRYELVINRVVDPVKNRQALKGTLSLAMVWHQHQPTYVDPEGDYLRGPWVRKHGTKDYYDMAAMLGAYPDVHVMVNLTPVLLMQLEDYYLKRLAPHVNLQAKTVDAAGYFAQRPVPADGGVALPVTDPWLDMLLTETPDPSLMSEQLKGWYYQDIWSNFSVADTIIDRWPAYKALRTKRDADAGAGPLFTKDELLQLKGYYQLAWFDPDFLKGPVTLTDGTVVDLTDLVAFADGFFSLRRPLTEADCRRLVAEEYAVLNNIVGAHKKLIYDASAKTGQIEVMTTPFYHPILPMLVDSALAAPGLPNTPLPASRYQQREDAQFHVAQAARTFTQRFGKPVTGMWPAEGSVAEDVVGLFAANQVKWVATDRKVLERSTPKNQSIYSPYRIDTDTVVGDGAETTDELAIIFRDTSISDKIGFQYQNGTPEANVADFLESLRRHAPDYGDERLLSIILDGENAWEWYKIDDDAKGFLNGMYTALTKAQQVDEFRTVTVSEYLSGNATRKVGAHPTHDLPELEPLFPASWIAGSFSTWVGEDEENVAWDYLAGVRADLAGFELQGLARPSLEANPAPGTREWHAFKAWHAMYAAEGSDWFWWYGADQTAGGGDEPFDRIYLELLKSVYRHAAAWGIATTVPDLVPILRYCAPSRGAMTPPTVDGRFDPDDGHEPSKPNEWTQKGSGACMDVDTGVGTNPDDVIRTFYHGQDASNVYLALRLSSDASTRLHGDWSLRLYLSHRHIEALGPPVVLQSDPNLATTRLGGAITMQAGGAARELELSFDGAGAVQSATLAVVSAGAWQPGSASAGVSAALQGDVLELAIPKSTLNYRPGDPLEMLVTIVSGATEVDRAPNASSIVVHADRSKLVEVTFVVDCTGTRLPLTSVKAITNPPPPEGTGRTYIVGSLPEIGSWAPNTISMSDDGSTLGDETANDNFWTFRMLVPPLTSVNYKYTIGSPGDGWGASEEYPLTNRGFEVSDSNGDTKMLLHDVFADRPEPSGSIPPMTQFINP